MKNIKPEKGYMTRIIQLYHRYHEYIVTHGYKIRFARNPFKRFCTNRYIAHFIIYQPAKKNLYHYNKIIESKFCKFDVHDKVHLMQILMS